MIASTHVRGRSGHIPSKLFAHKITRRFFYYSPSDFELRTSSSAAPHPHCLRRYVMQSSHDAHNPPCRRRCNSIESSNMIGGNRLLFLLMSSLGVAIILWYHDGGSSVDRSNDKLLSSVSMGWPSVSIDSIDSMPSSTSNQHDISDQYQEHPMLRIGESSSLETEDGALNSVRMLQQWYANPTFNHVLRKGIIKGMFNVIVFVAVWFVLMCGIGGAMRCYLCCETMRSNPNYTLRQLYDSFADRSACETTGSNFENESEGIDMMESMRRDGEVESDED